MTTQKYGEVGWGDVTNEGPVRGDSKDTFLRLEKGSNIVRIITSPFQYTVHRYKKEGDPGFGQKVMCSAVHGSCPLCALGDKAKRRWLVGVIDRKTKAYKILDMGISVFKSVQQYTRDDDWGDPLRYDLDIKVDPNGGASNYYQVTPKMPKPLSADDIQIRDMVDLEELRRRVVPPEAVKVQERLDRIFNGTPARGAGFSAAPAPVAAARTAAAAPAPAPARQAPAAPAVDMTGEDEDDDVSFPSYEQKM